MTMFERIDQILKERNISRRQLAALAELPPSSLQSALERKRNMTLEMTTAIAEALEVDVNWLMTGQTLEERDQAMRDKVAERIKSVRIDKKMTKLEVAKKCGIADSAIREYESGKITPKSETLFRIAKALDVSFDYLRYGYTGGSVRQEIDPETGEKRTIRHLDGFWEKHKGKMEGADLRDWVEDDSDLDNRLESAYTDLNTGGQRKVVDFAEDLAKIDDYKKSPTD